MSIGYFFKLSTYNINEYKKFQNFCLFETNPAYYAGLPNDNSGTLFLLPKFFLLTTNGHKTFYIVLLYVKLLKLTATRIMSQNCH